VDYRQELNRMELFSDIAPQRLDDILIASQVTDFSGQTAICRAGDPADEIFAVLDGQVQIYRGNDAKNAVLFVVRGGEVFGLRSALTTGFHTETAEAVSHCRVLRIPSSTFLAIVKSEPRFAGAVIHTLSERLQSVSDQFERIQLMPTHQRLADYLIHFAPGNGGAYEIRLPFEKKLIARYLGMGPESFSRAMKKLKGYGLSCKGRNVRIRDPETLRAICEGLDTSP